MTEVKKIRLGLFSFSCCEDNAVMITEIMNDHWLEWKKIFDFRYAPVLQNNNTLDELDIALIEGAVASETQANRIREIREKSKVVVAIGACAVMGMPSGQRNNFTKEQNDAIEFLIARFSALPKVLKVSDVVKVDAEIPGCPIDPKQFLDAVNGLVAKFQSS